MISPPCFHPFQGRPSFGQTVNLIKDRSHVICFHPFQGRPPFGHFRVRVIENCKRYGFHPFQGRPPFGREIKEARRAFCMPPFPSLSGKSSIRTQSSDKLPTIRVPGVSIPFREELHSDVNVAASACPSGRLCFHPFQVRAPFGHGRTVRD